MTAYDRYAVKAFEVHAVDYLLKSFDRERFGRAVERAKEEIRRSREGAERAAGGAARGSRIEEAAGDARGDQVSRANLLFPVEEIDWVEAADNYVRIHAEVRDI